MAEHCERTFDEALLSGYLDGALTQGDEQRVRLHLEDCATCGTLVEELSEVRDATMSSTFDTPKHHEWSEAPRTESSRLERVQGWPLLIAWATVFAGYTLWELWTEAEFLPEQLGLVAGVSGFALLFLGVLLDRLKTKRTDRYREVHK